MENAKDSSLCRCKTIPIVFVYTGSCYHLRCWDPRSSLHSTFPGADFKLPKLLPTRRNDAIINQIWREVADEEHDTIRNGPANNRIVEQNGRDRDAVCFKLVSSAGPQPN